LVVVDSRLQTPLDAKLMNPTQPGRDVWLYHSGIAGQEVQAGLSEAGAHLRAMGNAAGKVDLAALFADLAQREVNEVHVEAGSALNGSLLREGLVDEVVLYIAPRLLGQGSGLSSFGPLTELVQGIDMDFAAPSLIGPDVRLQALVRGADSFLNTPLYTHT
jgi:diaminohydroxyphosphoribosylaminopyrimidine deaminase/5-amino-6-(5-phosphoribosylamino)uracil reductase